MNKKMTKSYISSGDNVFLEGCVKSKGFLAHGEVNITNDKGQRILLGQYLYGKPDGKWVRWYNDGELCSEHQYVFGRLIGTSKQYWANGKLARECKHENGFHDYEEKIYNKKGGQEKHKVYKKGKLANAKIKVRGKWLDFDADLFKVKFPWSIIAEKLCYLNQDNKLRCKTPYQVWHDLNTSLHPETVENLLNQFNDLYADLGLNIQNTVLTSCGGTFVATKVNASSPIVNAADGHNASLTQRESDDITNACIAEVSAGLTANGGFDVNNSQSTRDAVNTIDQVVANCVDDDNSMIATAPLAVLGGACLAAPEACAAVVGGVLIGIGSITSTVISYVWDDGWTEEIEIRPGVYKSTSADNSGVTRTRDENTGATTVDQAGTAPDGNQGGRTVTTTEADDSSRTDYYDKDGNLIDTIYWDANGNQLPPPPQENPEPAPTPAPDPAPASGGGAGQPDENGMGKCEGLAAWWAMKKAHCERSNWQSYDCQETLRIFTRCVDPALVYPVPDGNGVICPHEGGMTNEDFRRIECERKSMIMMPSGFGGELCISRGDLDFPARDICSDPRAQCLPDSLVPDEPLNSQHPFINTRRRSRIAGQSAKGYSRTNGMPVFNSYTSVKEIDEENFEKRINAKHDETHFVVFASKSCGPCHKVLNVFNDESKNYKKATFNRVDVSQNPDLSDRFEIKYTPTILVFKNGKIIGQRRVGGARREVLVEYINRAFNLPGEKGEK